MEGKNTPPNKKHRKHPARRGSQPMGPPPPAAGQHVCLCSHHCSLFCRWKSICFSFFLQDTFGCCILISGLSNYIKFKPDLRFQKRRQRGNTWALTFKTTPQRQKYSLTKSCFGCTCVNMGNSTGAKPVDCLFTSLQLEQNRASWAYEIMGVQNNLNFLGQESLLN